MKVLSVIIFVIAIMSIVINAKLNVNDKFIENNIENVKNTKDLKIIKECQRLAAELKKIIFTKLHNPHGIWDAKKFMKEIVKNSNFTFFFENCYSNFESIKKGMIRLI